MIGRWLLLGIVLAFLGCVLCGWAIVREKASRADERVMTEKDQGFMADTTLDPTDTATRGLAALPVTALELVEMKHELLGALKIAVEAIRTWHGFGSSGVVEPQMWALYQESPEMKAINAAIAKADGRS